ncbi:hypothetical protein BST61_g552 [Cercospora zeina]
MFDMLTTTGSMWIGTSTPKAIKFDAESWSTGNEARVQQRGQGQPYDESRSPYMGRHQNCCRKTRSEVELVQYTVKDSRPHSFGFCSLSAEG